MINLEPAGLDALIKYCEDLGLDATEILRQAAIDSERRWCMRGGKRKK